MRSGGGREDRKDGLQHLKCQAKEFRFYFIDSCAFEQKNDVLKVEVTGEGV